MKSKYVKLGLTLFFAATLIGGPNIVEARGGGGYHGGGYDGGGHRGDWDHGGRGDWDHGGRGYHGGGNYGRGHFYWNGGYFNFFYNGRYYNNCKWVPAHWSRGVWIPARRVCW